MEGGVWGGMGAQSPAANPARMCHCRTLHAPLPAPGRSDGSAVPGPLPPLRLGTGKEGAPTPLTMLAGGGGGSGELALGLRTRPACTVQVMVPAGSGSPPPMQRQPLPHARASRGPSKKSAAPRPASSGTPGTIHPDPPAPPQRN